MADGNTGASMSDVVALGTLVNPQSSALSAPLNSTSEAYETSRVVKVGPGILYGFSGYNSKASAQFIQLFDANALPAEGAIPVMVITVPATSNFSYSPGVYGRAFEAGIVILNSSTGPTKTIGSADCWYDVQAR